MAGCDPKLNNCEKTGTGPSCSQDSEAGGLARKKCLDTVKENCETKIDTCLQECVENPIERENKDAKDAADQADEEAKARGKALEKCMESSESFKRTKQMYDYMTQQQSEYFRMMCNLYATNTEGFPSVTDVTPCSYKHMRGNRNFRAFGGLPDGEKPAWWSYSMTEAQYKSTLDYYIKQVADLAQQLKDICPNAVADDDRDPENPCREKQARAGNIEIVNCMADCYVQGISDCRTDHCYCGSYKCPAGQLESASHGGFGDPGPLENGKDPRITPKQMTLTLSAYEQPLELVYTRSFMPGNIIWMSPIGEERITRQDKTWDADKNKYVNQTTITINNYLSFHMLLCAGPIEAISRIWMDNRLIYDKSEGSDVVVDGQERLQLLMHAGSEAQGVFEGEANQEGFGRVPANRGNAGLIVHNLNVSTFTQFPAFRVEVVKSASDDSPAIASEVMDDLTGDIVKFDIAARRIAISTDDGVRYLDLDTLEEVRDTLIADARVSTDLPNVITYDGAEFSIYDVTFSELIAGPVAEEVPADLLIDALWTNDFNSLDHYLVTANTAGQIYFYKIRDSSPQEPLWYWQFDPGMGGLPTHMWVQDYLHTETTSTLVAQSSLFVAMRPDGDEIEVLYSFGHSTDAARETFENDGTFTVYADTEWAGATSISILGILPVERDGTTVLFLDVDGQHKIVKYNPLAATRVVWSLDTEELPDFGSRPTGRPGTYAIFKFVRTDGLVGVLDTDNGTLSLEDLGTPAIHATIQAQFYDAQIGRLTYFTDGDAFYQISMDRVLVEFETLADVVRDVMTRSGLDANLYDVSDLEAVEITGYRSGPAMTSRAILEPLFEVYPVGSFLDYGLHFRRKQSGDEVTINTDHMDQPFSFTRNLTAYDLKSASLTYYSDNQDGVEATQMFALPDDAFSGREQIIETYTVLETDDYMRSLAEMRVFATQENDLTARLRLPPRYLRLTPADQAFVEQFYRVATTTLGADLSIEMALELDNKGKYEDFVDVPGVGSFGRFISETEIEPISYPVSKIMRCHSPRATFSGCVYFGAGEVLEEFPGEAVLSIQPDSSAAIPGSSVRGVEKSLAWGKLVTPPPTRNIIYTTYREDTMVVKFNKPEYALRLTPLSEFSRPFIELYGEPFANLLMVGREFIRYRFAEIDPDGLTVTFTGLQRARECTDGFMEHAAGETVFIYDQTAFQRYDTFDAFESIKATITGNLGVARRNGQDISLADADVLAPLPLGGGWRTDLGTVDPERFNIFVETIERFQNAGNFGDNTVHVEVNYEVVTYSAFLYLLRAPFDANLFEADRFGDNTDYIMIRSVPVGWGDRGYMFTVGEQNVVGYDAEVEPLVAVFLAENDFETSPLIVRSWPAAPNGHFQRRARGI